MLSRDHVVESDTVTVCTRDGLENKAILIEILDHSQLFVLP